MGETRLAFRNKFLLLDNVYFILNINRILISISELYRQLFAIYFNNNEIIISRNSLQICCAKLEHGLYVLHPFESQNYQNQNLINVKNFQMINCISLDQINRLTKDGLLKI